ncbi:MAG: pantothenate kinase [Reinekea sp.]|jgi:pantothenate kinase
MKTVQHHMQQILTLIDAHPRNGLRLVLGISGPPGSGKSTLAEALVSELNRRSGADSYAVLLPMDGYHLENSVLIEQGMLARKGAPQTFDVTGLVSLMKRVHQPAEALYFPVFDRTLDTSLPNAGEINERTAIVVVEGNYLLLQSPPWNELRPLLDVTVSLAPSLETLEQRLIQRWLDHGHSLKTALERVQVNDLNNARLVLANSGQADLLISTE